MRITSTFYAAAMAAGVTLAAGPAFAQECACVFSASSGIIGKVESVTGDNVRVSQTAGFTRAESQGQLQSGWTVMVGPNSATTLVLGPQECVVNLTANQSMTLISQGSGNICAAVRSEAGAGTTTGAAVGALAGTALLVGGVIVFSQDDETISVSQQ